MPIIYTYPSVTPTAEDLLLISDVSETNPTKATRKCSVGDVVSLIGALVPGGGTVTSVDVSGGTTGLTTSGGPVTTSGTITLAGTLDADNGGTGQFSYTQGDIVYYDATATQLEKLGIGTPGQLLTVTGGLPAWASASSVAVTSIELDLKSTGLLVDNGVALPASSVTLTTPGGEFNISGTLIVSNGGTGVTSFSSGYFVKGNNATTLTEAQYVDLTSEVTGVLPVPNGGTGLSSLTLHGFIFGNNASNVSVSSAPTHGQLPIGNTGNDPTITTLTEGTGIDITNGAGSIEIAVEAASSGGPLAIEDESVILTAAATSIDFTGAGVTATTVGSDVTVNIPSGGGGGTLQDTLDLGAIATSAAGSYVDQVSIETDNTLGTYHSVWMNDPLNAELEWKLTRTGDTGDDIYIVMDNDPAIGLEPRLSLYAGETSISKVKCEIDLEPANSEITLRSTDIDIATSSEIKLTADGEIQIHGDEVDNGSGTDNGDVLSATNSDGSSHWRSIASADGSVNITINTDDIDLSAGIGAPTKVAFNDSLELKGSISGTITAASFTLNRAYYWTLGDYVYMEFYLEWIVAHGCVGDMIMDKLPIPCSSTGNDIPQGNCLVSNNAGLGTNATEPAPGRGIVGVTDDDEILFQNILEANAGEIRSQDWSYVHPEASPWKLAGTATWLANTE